MILHRFVKIIAFLLCKLFFLIRSFNKCNILKRGGVIIACNHMSFLDPVILGAVVFRPVNFMAKKELFDAGRVFGKFLSLLGVFSVSRGSLSKSTVKKAIKILKSKGALVIFPEGGRSRDGSIQKGEPGCVWLARVSGASIVPVRIYGSDKALPVNRNIFCPYPIKVVFGKPLNAAEYPYSSIEDITEILMDRISEL